MKIPFQIKRFSLLLFITFLFSIPIYAQNVNVTGSVVDASDSNPLVGVTVSVKGTTKGVMTDIDGQFTIQGVPASGTLTFSYMGYEEQSIPIKSKSVVNVKLNVIASSLDEIVVIGYGAVRKRDLTSSIAKVQESDIEKTPVMSLDQALQGNAAGVMVINTSAEPGGDISMRIRGGSSIMADNTPLIVVDGFPMEGNFLSMLNPSDILSMEVLKDASATSIYGSRGANGVVMVTTKKGQSGKPKVDLRTQIHYTKLRRVLPMLDGPLYQMYNNIGRQAMGTAVNTLRPDTFQTRDFQSQLILPHVIIQEYNATVSGGGDQFNYLLSGNVLDQPGLLLNSNFQRMSLRGKFNVVMSKNLDFQFNYSGNTTGKQRTGGGDSGATLRTLMMNPTSTANGVFENGLFIDEETGEILSANTEISKSMYTQDISDDFMNEVNGALNWKVSKRMVFRTTGGYRMRQSNTYYYVPASIYLTQANINKNNITKRGSATSTKWINENTLTYMNTFAEKHNLTAMIGQSWESTNSIGFSGQARGLEDDFQWDALGGAKLYDSMGSSKSEYSMLSYFGRFIYNHDDRYLATLTMRADGSSRFGPDSKWGYFPSASFAWIVTNEKFVKKTPLFSNLKLRASYGLTGNDGIGNYKSWSTLKAAGIVINGQTASGYTTSNIGDKSLSWEQTAMANLGFDLGLFTNRFFFTFDVYDKRTYHLLYNYRLPNTTGYTSVATNIGEVHNQGLEVEFSSQNLTNKSKFKWNTSLNIGINKGQVVDLGGDDNLIAYQMTSTVNTPITYLMLGQPLGTFKGYKTDGVYKDWDDVYNSASVWYDGVFEKRTQPGYPKYVDKNGDGVIDENDKEVLGHAQPDMNLGFTNTFSYKNFELVVFFTGAFGNSVVNVNKAKLERYRGGSDNQVKYVMNGYRPMNPLTGDPGYYHYEVPRAIYGSTEYTQNLTDLFVEDASYLRLRTVSLAYNLPKKFVQKAGLRNCRFQVSAINLLTWTEYTGMDPESSSSLGDSNTSLGVDQSSYPAYQSIVFSLNLGF